MISCINPLNSFHNDLNSVLDEIKDISCINNCINDILNNIIDSICIVPIDEYTQINVNLIEEIKYNYPEKFIMFCKENELKPPTINTSMGKALSCMLYNPFKYWTRDDCDLLFKKFNIKSRDSIQAFNKHSQWGIKTNSGIHKGKLYIIYPYCLSNKHKMRKDFKYDGSESQKNEEINKIKMTIKTDYIDIPNNEWQLGHKNPGTTDNSSNNLVLQPPIQAKYRDNYVFFDTLTKFPLPKKLKAMFDSKELHLTKDQIDEYCILFNQIKLSLTSV